MPNRSEIVSTMRQALSITEPTLDTSLGTPVRKILDVIAESVADAYADRHMLVYQYDIDAKSGADLDDFVSLFGFTRLPARRATGNVTFERQLASDISVFISVGSQVSTATTPSIVFSTIVPSVLGPGETSITVPVQAVQGGNGGNVSAGAITQRVSDLVGINGFTNQAAMTGGTAPESDEQLRDRFKRTVFRNLAGTEQMLRGIALDDQDVSLVNVVGVTKVHREQVEISSGSATSQVQDAGYTYPKSSVFGPDIDGGDIKIPGAHYTFDDTADPPDITVLDGTEVPDGIYDLQFEYVSTASRNDPDNGIVNKVDIYLNGTRPTAASENAVFKTADVFNVTTSSELYRQNFRRLDDTVPAEDNHFVRLGFAPAIDASVLDQITIGAETYDEGTDYWLVNDITPEGLAHGSLTGIEFLSAANGQGQPLPSDGTVFLVDYLFNAVPRDVQDAIERWRLLTTDVLVHQAKTTLLDLHLIVMLEPGYTAASVKPDMFSELSKFIAQIGFSGVVQVSDLLAVAHSTSGVDAVRFATDDDDGTDYAIQRMATDGTTALETYDNGGTPARAIDVLTGDDEVPVLNDIHLTAKAQNTFGVV